MLAQVTYIQKFMAGSEDEFMPICMAANAAFVANNPKHLPVGHRLDARRPADATIFGTHITDGRPMPQDVPR